MRATKESIRDDVRGNIFIPEKTKAIILANASGKRKKGGETPCNPAIASTRLSCVQSLEILNI
ncbi:TPA: hypothetical protein N2C34_003399 [Pseudomonas aeruginosa]|uniref:hypothetical protein n=1 Tax=Pseudomonas aeruginosa TaxID=287 RepID=UPI00137B213E|nr:hypothetical protein [Pseudomonas aeruginosa]MBG5233144.1 hypothetical protein [Pseudomonas aeruginosa]MBH9333498.1 hypothetical protein [Pseudomonas aeruginosa]HCF6221995.1 hypothetical protein [Pseudomonas aeruginosa]HCL4207477.1 hypothetical protein [Pseudomonas aeruginosa]HEO1661023.1 hypothetical protein [Pseudomonas aeruginosa]